MKVGMAISATVLLLLVGALYLKTRPNAADQPTAASSEANLQVQSLPKDLPGFGFVPGSDAGSTSTLFATAKDAERWVRGGFEDEKKVQESGAVIDQLIATSKTSLPAGFLDGKPDDKAFEPSEKKKAMTALGTAAKLHINWHIEEFEFDRARAIALAQLYFGKQAFEKNTRLKARQNGLATMKAALRSLGNITHAQQQDGEIEEAESKKTQAEVMEWFDAISAIEDRWNAKLAATETVNSKKNLPNIADLIKIANDDKDRTFRIYAARRLGYALFERGDPGNQIAINEALDQLENDSDKLVAAAAKAGRSIKDKDEYYELRK